MKHLFTAVLLIGCIAAFAQNPIDGQWKGLVETPDGPIEVNPTFKVEGKVLTGTWNTQFGETKLENGKVEGKKFSYTISINGMTIHSNGELISQDEILIKDDFAEFKLTRAKSRG